MPLPEKARGHISRFRGSNQFLAWVSAKLGTGSKAEVWPMPSLIADGSDANNTRAEEACNKAHSICLLYNRTRSAEKVCPGSFSFAHSSAIAPLHLPLSLSTLVIICRKSPPSLLGNLVFFGGITNFQLIALGPSLLQKLCLKSLLLLLWPLIILTVCFLNGPSMLE